MQVEFHAKVYNRGRCHEDTVCYGREDTVEPRTQQLKLRANTNLSEQNSRRFQQIAFGQT